MTMDPGTYYVPEGESRRLQVTGIRVGNNESEVFSFVDGSALFLLCTIEEASTDEPLMLKQFGASRLLLAGLHPSALDTGQVVEIERYEGGGYDVDLDPGVEDAADAM